MAIQVEVRKPATGDSAEEYLSYEEFLKQYAGQHAEWIVGKVEVQVPNNEQHQNILIFLTTLLNLYFGLTSLGRLLTASFSMRISDEVPAREPDLLVILNEHKDRITPTYLDGPADIVIEIVSPESVERDYNKKFLEYEQAGVPEYWLFDPLRRIADIHLLDAGGHFRRLVEDSEGNLVSSLLPGFALNPDVLWQDELPNGIRLIEMVQAMAKSAGA